MLLYEVLDILFNVDFIQVDVCEEIQPFGVVNVGSVAGRSVEDLLVGVFLVVYEGAGLHTWVWGRFVDYMDVALVVGYFHLFG